MVIAMAVAVRPVAMGAVAVAACPMGGARQEAHVMQRTGGIRFAPTVGVRPLRAACFRRAGGAIV